MIHMVRTIWKIWAWAFRVIYVKGAQVGQVALAVQAVQDSDQVVQVVLEVQVLADLVDLVGILDSSFYRH